MKNVTCGDVRDGIALELYGELEADDHARLAEHLADCPGCRAARGALHAGLGQLVDRAPSRTAAAGRPAHSPILARSWAAAAIGFAAGVLATGFLAANLRTPTSDEGAAVAQAPPATDPRAFRRALPPPRAASSGRLAEIGPWMRE